MNNTIISLFVFCVILFSFGSWAFSKKSWAGGITGYFLGAITTFFLFAFVATIDKERREAFGQPRIEIAAGTYKVGFVYKAGSRVNVGVERGKEKEGSVLGSASYAHLFLYQFPASAFAGEVNPNACWLKVTERGGFKKLELFLQSPYLQSP